ncbi:MAG: hypothetical protein ACHQU8_05595 [Gemmatimonadales bacterium]
MNEKDELDGSLGRAFVALDARATRAARKVNAELVAASVLKRLREGDSEPMWRPMWRLTVVRAAAALVLMAATTVTVVRFASRPRPDVALPVMEQIEEFSAGDLDSMLTAVDEVPSLNATYVPSTATLDDMSSQELEALLSAMDSPGGTT